MNIPQPGNYRARATTAKLGWSNNDKPQVAILFKVVDPNGTEFTGEEIAAYLSLAEGAFEITIKALRACGWQGENISDLSTVGSEDCEIVVGEEEYQGKVQTKVRWVNRLGGALQLKREMAPDEALRFARSVRGRVIAASGGSPHQRPAAQPTAPTPAQPGPPRPPAQPMPRPTSSPRPTPAPHPNAPGAEDYYEAPPVGDDDIGF